MLGVFCFVFFFDVCEGSIQFSEAIVDVEARPPDRCSAFSLGLLKQLDLLLKGSTWFAWVLLYQITSLMRSSFH